MEITKPNPSAIRTPRQPSRTALATRSLTAALRLTGDEQREALRKHFEEFAPPIYRTCPARHQ